MTRADWDERKRQWAYFEEWRRTAPLAEHPSETVIAEVDALYHWIPESSRLEDPDPERRGVQRMHHLLSLMKAG